ncbi:MAG: hypothetical protein CBC27_03440 [Opitutia bacterium TMED67]|nr:MAG: hypothetical protein CBC27_03440 [Opitutae bacterium TMED67]|tara:strand:+ start:466 stop:888 length:423 start_codon:yes stop_codon:yes gene_type:complete
MTDPFYIIYDSEDQAHIRSEQAGAMRGLSYSQTGTGSRYWWGWIAEHKEENARVAIALPTTTENWFDDETLELLSSEVVAVDKDILTDEDEIVENLPSDWAYPPEPLIEETPQRARDADGKFIADDPTTPDVDEAWTQPD